MQAMTCPHRINPRFDATRGYGMCKQRVIRGTFCDWADVYRECDCIAWPCQRFAIGAHVEHITQ